MSLLEQFTDKYVHNNNDRYWGFHPPLRIGRARRPPKPYIGMILGLMRFLNFCRIRAPPNLLNLAVSREKNQVFTKARYLDKTYRFGFPMPRGSQKYQTRHGAAANLGSYC